MRYDTETKYHNIVFTDKSGETIGTADQIRLFEKTVQISTANYGIIGENHFYSILTVGFRWSKKYDNFSKDRLFMNITHNGRIICRGGFNISRNFDTGEVAFSN